MTHRPTPTELPDPHASYVVSGVIVEAWIRSSSRKQGRKFLAELKDVLEEREKTMHVFPSRTPSARDILRVEREALAAIRQLIIIWTSKLPPK